MQYHLFTLAAALGTVYAQDNASADAAQLISVVSVLQTALPSSLLQEALTNSAGVSSELASEFAAGETPSWFTALPSDVQTYLVSNTGVIPSATAITTTDGMSSSSATGGLIPSTNGTVIRNGTSTAFASPSSSSSSSSPSPSSSRAATRTSTTLTEGVTGSETKSSATRSKTSSSSTSEAGAGVPTAAVIVGFAGLAGVVGVLAL